MIENEPVVYHDNFSNNEKEIIEKDIYRLKFINEKLFNLCLDDKTVGVITRYKVWKKASIKASIKDYQIRDRFIRSNWLGCDVYCPLYCKSDWSIQFKYPTTIHVKRQEGI